MVAGEEAGLDGFGRVVQWMAALFYANNEMLALPRSAWIHADLYFLTGLFDRVGIQTNINKTVGMACQSCYIVVGHLEVAYTQRMMGVGSYFWEQQ